MIHWILKYVLENISNFGSVRRKFEDKISNCYINKKVPGWKMFDNPYAKPCESTFLHCNNLIIKCVLKKPSCVHQYIAIQGHLLAFVIKYRK